MYVCNRLIAIMPINLQRPELTSNVATAAKCSKWSKQLSLVPSGLPSLNKYSSILLKIP